MEPKCFLRVSDGIKFNMYEDFDKVAEGVAYALFEGAMVKVYKPDKTIMRYVNPFQILYVEGPNDEV